jgi:NADH-quinone oxidoreductase subunit J
VTLPVSLSPLLAVNATLLADVGQVAAQPRWLMAIAVATAAVSLWLLLPKGLENRRARPIGVVLGSIALACFALAGRRLGSLGEEAVFLLVAGVAVVSATATIVTRSPVYAAIWFAMTLAGVSGVLLVLDAQFLGVATIVVYAGAILVMFLFVLMLAQPSGLASYDRVSSEPMLAAIAGAVLVGLLTVSIGRLSAPAALEGDQSVAQTEAEEAAAAPTAVAAPDQLRDDHVARLGGELFGRHLVAVEAAGVLLFVALVGAIAVVTRGEAAALAEGRPTR